MLCKIEDSEYTFSQRSVERSKVLSRVRQESEPGSNCQGELPALPLDGVRLWDEDVDVVNLPLYQIMLVAKVRFRC